MNMIRALVIKLFFPVLLAIISGVIAAVNYTPNTFLTGWDTLHPEFNFQLAFERLLNGVWRSDQGLGTVGIQSHMADLPRVFILWVLSFILPLDTLRYTTMLFALFIGPLGVYFLVKNLITKPYSRAIAFISSLSYLCSLGTVQHFVVPLEMFAFHYAFIPWAFLFLKKYLTEGKTKNLLSFTVANVLLIPQAHTATLFYAYFGCILLYGFAIFLTDASKTRLKKLLGILILTLFINAYWIIPNLYTIRTHADEMRNSRINRFFTKEAFAKNQLYGKIQYAPILENFLFDWKLYDFKKNESVDVTGPWVQHIKNPIVRVFGYLISLIGFIGMMYVIIKKKKTGIPFILPTMAAFLLLLNGSFPMTFFFTILGNISETAKEAIRFPFTKFSILFMFGLSVFFAYGLECLFSALKKRVIVLSTIIIFILGFGYYFYPAFKGNLVSPAMRVSIPKEYFEMFDWFESKPKYDKVATLPIHSFWGWAYYNWGYQGAGFLQFGIPQPIMDRDHDRWSRDNEQYQREMQYALYSHNITILEETLEKYKIKYILFDKSITNVAGSERGTLSWYIPELLKSSKKIDLVESFGENIFIYEFRTTNPSLLQVYSNIPDVGPKMVGDMNDRVYSNLGPYITSKPFDFDLERAYYTYDERYTQSPVEPIIHLINSDSTLPELSKCSSLTTQSRRTKTVDSIVYESTNGPLCDHFAFPDASHFTPYILEVTSRNLEGFPLQIYICNNLTDHCHQTIHLHAKKSFDTERFIIPLFYDYGTGYTININNFAIRTKSSKNEIKEITFRKHNPPAFISSQQESKFRESGQVKHFSPGKSTVKIQNLKKGDTIVYNERFSEDWKAIYYPDQTSRAQSLAQKIWPFFGAQQLTDHSLANNWANAWTVDSDLQNPITIHFIFAPQILQNIGFVLLLLVLLFFLNIHNIGNLPKINQRYKVKSRKLKEEIDRKLRKRKDQNYNKL